MRTNAKATPTNDTNYRTLKNFGGEKTGKFGEFQQFAKFLRQFLNFHSIIYGFTIAC